MYVKLVEALCAEHQINLIKVRVFSRAPSIWPLCVCVSVMTTWLPLLSPVRKLPFVTQLLLRHTDILVHEQTLLFEGWIFDRAAKSSYCTVVACCLISLEYVQNLILAYFDTSNPPVHCDGGYEQKYYDFSEINLVTSVIFRKVS